MEPQEKPGVGSLLKSEREEKGISIDQLARITKLRKHFIEALENEAWQDLPSPVYVKGFIRSYAQGVGFDGKEAIRLYESIAPVEEEIPKPLTEFRVPKKRPAFFLVVFIAVLAVIVYLFAGKKSQIFQNKGDIILVQEEQEKETQPAAEHEPEQIEPDLDLDLIEAEPEGEPLFLSEPQPELEELSDSQEEDAVIIHQTEPAPTPVVDEFISFQAGDKHVLTAIINLRTYIKIYVDDNNPKEYIFQPGSRPQWTASEGFDILVGNAAGVEFEFNGKKIKDLGGRGKVIRVRLPEGFESKIYESIRDLN